jgi:ATP-dependent DNA helicase RecG
VAVHRSPTVVANPGGLFGAVTEDDLGSEGVSSSRNPVLVKLLQDVRLPDSDRTVCENRGSGIPVMLREMRRSGSALPEFHNRITRFRVILPKHALLDAETMVWLGRLGADGLTPTQHMALALMRAGKQVSNQILRNLGLDGRRATTELCDLVTRGLAVRVGERRHARYLLAPAAREPAAPPTSGSGPALVAQHQPPRPAPEATERGRAPTSSSDQVLAVLSAETGLRRHEVEQRTGLSRMVVLRSLNALIEAGLVEADAPPNAPNRRYRRCEHPDQGQRSAP